MPWQLVIHPNFLTYEMMALNVSLRQFCKLLIVTVRTHKQLAEKWYGWCFKTVEKGPAKRSQQVGMPYMPMHARIVFFCALALWEQEGSGWVQTGLVPS